MKGMTLRNKITFGSIGIILLSYFAVALVVGIYMNRVYISQVQVRVEHDLFTARHMYEAYVERVYEILQAVSIRRRTSSTLEQEIEADLGNVFRSIYLSRGLDIMTLVDPEGRVLFRAHNPDLKGDDISANPMVRKVLGDWKPARGTLVIPAEMLKAEGEEICRRASIEILPTPKARPDSAKTNEAGMFIAAAVPVYSLHEEERLGILLGGCLLNRNDAIVDEIKSEVYGSPVYGHTDAGTVTIFLNDLRISTNVTFENNERAIGSRLSEEVYDHVIREGKVWSDRAFVVRDWYITSYEPLRDIEGNIVGSLYVGVLEAPYKQPQKILILFIMGMLCFTALSAFLLIYFYMRRMMKPVDSITEMGRKIMQGDLSARCEIRPSGEIGLLCRTIDQMADAFERYEKNLQKETQLQIGQSEKLAAIGRLAAGVAHEINNPLTSILNFAHLMKQKKSNDEQDMRDLNVIIDETNRVRRIVRELLDFARQAPAGRESIRVNELLRQLVSLIVKQKEFRDIRFLEDYDESLEEFVADKNQIQQVFLNLLMNSAESITGGGEIRISTAHGKNQCTVSISDTGCGIRPEEMGKIFDPFYTTKPVGKGTGLGLSVSYGIITQHGGEIRCESNVGEGTTFTVVLPCHGTGEALPD